MDILGKITDLRIAKGWSIYKLADESGISQSTLSNMYARKTDPSISTLTLICEALGITLSEFFAENNLIEASPEVKKLYDDWRSLSKNEQDIIAAIVKSYTGKK